jgi:hypothetical protein
MPSSFEERRGELEKKKLDLQQMERSPGWKDWKRAIQEQVTTRRMMVGGMRIDSLDKLFEFLSLHHEALGMATALAVPGRLIEDIEVDLKQLLDEERTEHGTD